MSSSPVRVTVTVTFANIMKITANDYGEKKAQLKHLDVLGRNQDGSLDLVTRYLTVYKRNIQERDLRGTYGSWHWGQPHALAVALNLY